MKKLVFWIILIGGSIFISQVAEGYWVVGFIGLCLAFALIHSKVHTSDALRIFGFVIVWVLFMLGGGIIVARQWGEFAAGVWTVFSVVLLMLSMKLFKKLVPILNIAEKFDEIVKEKSEKKLN
jgi:hypothetical protein